MSDQDDFNAVSWVRILFARDVIIIALFLLAVVVAGWWVSNSVMNQNSGFPEPSEEQEELPLKAVEPIDSKSAEEATTTQKKAIGYVGETIRVEYDSQAIYPGLDNLWEELYLPMILKIQLQVMNGNLLM